MNDAQVATQFSTERPVLGLCLKRYSMLPNGRAIRLNTYVDIPLEIGLPHFIRDDDAEDDGPQFGNFKLSLQSAVCHRGVSVDEGHYIALVRSRATDSTNGNGHILSQEQMHALPEPVGDRWMRFDDLARERVTYVDIEKALKEESPYLLFYQVQPVEEPLPRTIAEPPPPYTETSEEHQAIRRERATSETSSTSAGNYEFYQRPSVDLPSNDVHGRISTSSGRPLSGAFNDFSNGGPIPSKGSERPSSEAPRQGTGVGVNEQKGAVKSQPEEGRLSATFSKLAARMSRDRLRTGESKGASASESAQVATDATTEDPGSSNANGQLKKSKRRGKSKVRVDVSSDGGQLTTTNDKPPDRECGIM